ncbi:MAG: ABC transporter ATP-binding protein [Herpetosiphon sp.]
MMTNGISPARTITRESINRSDARLPVLELDDVFKIYREHDIETVALRGTSLQIMPGEFVAIIGPSGSGKSTLLGLAAGLTAPSAGSILVTGDDMARLSEDERALVRAEKLGVVLQSNNLIPFLSAHENVEIVVTHGSRAERQQRATSLLERVGLGNRLRHRPAQLSGGEQQRVAIAVALANEPRLLLADELTGELDSNTAAEIMDLLHTLNHEQGVAIVLVTHNPLLAAQAGRTVRLLDGLLTPLEYLPAIDLEFPDACPTAVTDAAKPPAPAIVEATNINKRYGSVVAVHSATVAVAPGESLAIMGPSGCGKSTLLSILGGLERPTAGTVLIGDQLLAPLDTTALALLRRNAIGFVFQSHNLIATLTAVENIALPLLLDGVGEAQRTARALALLDLVGLGDLADKLPDQMSGGQRQRVAIVRSMAHRPRLLLADEPTGSLDSVNAAQIAALLVDLTRAEGVALIMVTHDPAVAAQCQRVRQMRDGILFPGDVREIAAVTEQETAPQQVRSILDA